MNINSFGRPGGGFASQQMMQSPGIEAAAHDVDMVTKMFNNMVNSCYGKCMTGYQQPELSKAESICVDRCVTKYFRVNMLVSTKLNAMGQQAEEMRKQQQQS